MAYQRHTTCAPWRETTEAACTIRRLVALSLAVGLIRGEASFGPLLFAGYLPYTGPGNYFLPLLVQFVLLSPLVFWGYMRRPRLTMLTLFGCNLAFELLAPNLALFETKFLYSACVLRYGAAIALGIWIADDESFASCRNWFVLPYAVVGFLYILASQTTAFALPFLPDWGTQNLVSFGWALFLTLVLLKGLRVVSLPPRWSSGLCRVGQASYEIYVFQIAWFSLALSGLLFSADSELAVGQSIEGLLRLALLAVNLLVCTILGTWWHERLWAN